MVLEKGFIDMYVEAMQNDYRHLIMPALAKKDYQNAQSQLERYMTMYTRDADKLFAKLPLGDLFFVGLSILYRNVRAAAGGEEESKEAVNHSTANVSQLLLRISNQRKAA